AGVTAREGDEVPVGQRVAVILRPGEVPAAPARPPASPLARRLAGAAGLDLARLAGSGPGGALKAAHLPRAAPAPPPPPPPPPPPAPPARERGIWPAMARRTAESWAAVPHFYLEREVDAGRLESWRASALRTTADVTITDLLVRLAGACLPRHPLVNGRWDGARTVAGAGVHVGIAGAVEPGLA